MLHSYELVNMMFATSQPMNCIQLSSQLVKTNLWTGDFLCRSIYIHHLWKEWWKMDKSCKARFDNKLSKICSWCVVYLIIILFCYHECLNERSQFTHWCSPAGSSPYSRGPYECSFRMLFLRLLSKLASPKDLIWFRCNVLACAHTNHA